MAADKREAELRRLRWSVPRADVSTNEWLDKQYDISQSLRILIRESIQREGYIDVANKPVEQLPRRGRPPGDANEQREADSAAGRSPADAGEESADRHGGVPKEDAPVAGRGTGAAAAEAPDQDSAPISGPVDMDSIFGNRN